jgi:uncharacterized cupredoxin-like copper-binding protein
VLTLGLAACGDDEPEGEAALGPDAGGAPEGSPDSEAFCGALTDLNDGVMAIEIDETTPEADVVAAGEQLAPSMTAIVDNAPEDLAATAGELDAVVQALLDGDASTFNSDETFATYSGFMADAGTSCAFEEVDVTLVDYAFEGVPESLPAGPTTFRVTNDSDVEMHEMVVFRMAEGVDLSFAEVLELPEEESESMVVFGGAAFAPPGETGATLVDLEPGEYAMACFVPVGSGEEGAPHFTQGMVEEFTVE